LASEDEEKSEEPTAKRLQEARSKGNVARSADLNSAAMALAGMLALWWWGDNSGEAIRKLMLECFSAISNWDQIPGGLVYFVKQGLYWLLLVLFPYLLFFALVGAAAGLLQVGWLFTFEPLTPKLGKVFNLQNFMRLFNGHAWTELVKSIIKMIVVAWVGYTVVEAHFYEFLHMADMSLHEILALLFNVILEMLFKIALTLLAMGILDFFLQKHRYVKQLRMSKQEIKDEARNMEGDPQIKGKIRNLRMQMHRNMMMKELPKATVVITNPTHLAIAFRYQQGHDSAPVVVAKGKRLIAERIKEVARKHSIPLIENKPLARAMFDVVVIGEQVPEEFFTPLAEILAYVYRLKEW